MNAVIFGNFVVILLLMQYVRQCFYMQRRGDSGFTSFTSFTIFASFPLRRRNLTGKQSSKIGSGPQLS